MTDSTKNDSTAAAAREAARDAERRFLALAERGSVERSLYVLELLDARFGTAAGGPAKRRSTRNRER